MLALALLCSLASGGTAVVEPRATTSSTMSEPRSSLAAGLTMAGVGATLFWTRRIADDISTRGREREAHEMIARPLPIGAIGAGGAMVTAGVLADPWLARE